MKFEKSAASVEIDWMIDNFKKDVISKITRKTTLNSKKISIDLGDNQTIWMLSLYVEDGHINLKPNLIETKDFDFRAKFLWFIPTKVENQNIFPYFEKFEIHCDGYGNLRFDLNLGPLDDLFNDPENYYIVNNTLTIKMKIELINGFILETEDCWNCFPSKNHLFWEYEHLFKSKTFCDFTIVCSDGIEIPTHRIVLAANSPVFKTMLQINMQESITNRVIIQDINGEVMEEVLKFMYCQNHEHFFCSKNLKEVYYVAEKYQILNLKKHCVECMIDVVDTDCIIDFLELSHFYNDNYLMQRCLMFILSNQKEVIKKHDLIEMNYNLFEIFMEFYQNYKIKYLIYSSSLIPNESLKVVNVHRILKINEENNLLDKIYAAEKLLKKIEDILNSYVKYNAVGLVSREEYVQLKNHINIVQSMKMEVKDLPKNAESKYHKIEEFNKNLKKIIEFIESTTVKLSEGQIAVIKDSSDALN